MPPKTTNEQHDNSNLSFPSQHGRSLSDISVGEILLKYQDNSQLLNQILVAKAQEDKRRTAEELRQVEEARLQTKFIEYELTQRQDNYVQQNDSNGSLFGHSLLDQDPFDNGGNGASLQARLDNAINSCDFHYGLTTENVSITSSPSMDFISPSAFDLYGDQLMLSSSPPPSDDIVLFPPKPKKNKKSPKNIHRTLSYESVMTLSDMSIRPSSSPPPPPLEPLDHDKVMEALRAKLRKSSSPYPTRPKPSPEPVPIPNTYPTTGVLLLNLKSRRRKSSLTKRSNSSTKP